ncbi:two component transcriptional regulator, winged helix family [Kribbella flavida DSM 17836]|uniref:Two component transcriptional regulator, winged helix family n=1 Tax=Kribbella flavida (strain DSM 17836 / JCM 10339 / NBRC 14399) TaxID=479435 RepID=D2PLZ1_KRIFD|nr:response regulator transcription factor [Kribbella flavida]ADB32571.1 two component transcriptional regulator, winged helix family [Kribbella flavida DSM 17836]
MRILVVEDERRLARAIGHGLEDHGFTVELAHDGETGLWKGREQDYDAIVLDLMLPGLSGDEVCRQLRAAGCWTPILILTARVGAEAEAGGLNLGADDYLRKPFSYQVLIARLNALLRRTAPARPVNLVVGDLVLDPARRTVRRGTTPIELTRREFSVLEYLMRNAGSTRSKAEILDHVWGADFDREPNVVEVYVGYLRRKIDQPFGTGSIRTVRGHGYLMGDEDPRAPEPVATGDG